MRRIEPHPLWFAHAGDLRSPEHLLGAGVRAVVDLAANEPIPALPRDLIYCHFPLFDGPGNEPALVRCAVRTAAELLASGIPTCISCSNGLSRSPAVAAAAIAGLCGTSPDEELIRIATQAKHDVSPGLWKEIRDAIAARGVEE